MAPAGPAHIPAFLFGTLIASVGYGIAITLFIKSIGTILRKRRATGKLNYPLVIPSVLIFILTTVNVIGLWINIHRAFVVYGADPESYLGLIRTPAKTIIQTGQLGAIILADALVVYRTWVVWSHKYIIIVVPSFTFVATVISGIWFVTLQHQVSNANTSVFTASVTQWTVSFLLCSFATTIISTGLIVFKLLRTQFELRQHNVSGGSATRRVGRILVESAALYSLNHLLYAALYEVKNQVEITPSFLEASVASITCSMIIIRSEKAFHRPPTSIGSDPVTVVASSPPGSGKYQGAHDGKVTFNLQNSMGVNVNVKTEFEGQV